MPIDIYGTHALNRVVESIDPPPSWLLDTYFPGIQTEPGVEDIHFDVDDSKPRIAPFVSPMVAGRVVRSKGFSTRTFRPAYVKDKRVFRPNQPMRRTIGEPIGGNLSPMERRAMLMRSEMLDQQGMLLRREEVMASEALRAGQVTVSGEDYPTVIVDFGRDADLTVTLSGTDMWTEADTSLWDPIDDLEEWSGRTQKYGAPATTVTMDPKAWQAFRKHPRVEKLLDTRRGSSSQAETGPLARGRGSEAVRFGGTIGDFEIWVYNDTYLDEDGVEQQVLPDYTVIMGSPTRLQGTRCYGSILDEESGYAAERTFVKTWLEKDPAVRYLLMQSAPLVVPYRVNVSFCATVG